MSLISQGSALPPILVATDTQRVERKDVLLGGTDATLSGGVLNSEHGGDRNTIIDNPNLQSVNLLPEDQGRELNTIRTGIGLPNRDNILPTDFANQPRIDGGTVVDPRNRQEASSNGEQFVGMGPMLTDPEVIEMLKKLGKLAAGEQIDPADLVKRMTESKEMLRNALAAKLGKDPSQITDHNLDVAQKNLDSGGTLDSAASAVQKDPLVFDLNHDGDTNCTVDQHGINVDGSTSTKWAEKGDGVLAFGDTPIGTEGGKYGDALETLAAKAQEAGIDTSKGFLDQADLKVLESKGLTMMVSNGDGTNKMMAPTELGISQISLKGKTPANSKDVEGNTISTQSSFVQNGQQQLMNDMWLNEIPVKKP